MLKPLSGNYLRFNQQTLYINQKEQLKLPPQKILSDTVLYHVRLNTYTLEKVRQKAGGRRQKERKG
ncbi:MAG: hypothetical protein F6K54_31280 [Okeania sp. SIO3B5]|uniref:hypothetical protein n=1 Tax=Okeania sp. SIO3B5 TaxID=2607811 RepID=UPI0014014F1C|nr:hypothetical protein [Okeania sp. SIO3B5]NEO57163.1 hypothetical protein [Okeania sp. SIO3B5]